MFSRTQILGDHLPDKTLCLTFDDGPGETITEGPGPRTLALAEYLHRQGIGATFFFSGIHLVKHPAIMPRVAGLGHIVGNHTYSHYDLPDFFARGGDIVREMSKVEELISAEIPFKKRYFRAPYGYWNESIADYLNENMDEHADYIGPVNWDISCSDFDYWARAAAAAECAEAYLAEICKVGKGIVLMHDSTADNDTMKTNNLTFESIRILVPELRRRGYSFINLDAIF